MCWADTCGPASSGRGSALLAAPRLHAGHDAPPIPVWAGRKDDDPPALEAARAERARRAEEEHRRLLYVAMTRAKDRLVVCGHDIGGRGPRAPGTTSCARGLRPRPGSRRWRPRRARSCGCDPARRRSSRSTSRRFRKPWKKKRRRPPGSARPRRSSLRPAGRCRPRRWWRRTRPRAPSPDRPAPTPAARAACFSTGF
ncbi:3'-5' exonuclease [Chenggangzhangella methanolivorans]|uniref:3'-5' exonuclease n=1 Tax=Chenggangzhangella methanolivorans TaxID=1437009 RepID=UPI0021BD15C0|nr:3'-5' exonuclease [Chenggangzhangella methanolivorans]